MHKYPKLSWSLVFGLILGMGGAVAKPLEIHRIFSSNMVIQQDKPIVIWGWTEPGRKVSVQLGGEKSEAAATGQNGRWEAVFPSRPADSAGQKLVVVSGDETIALDNILIGDVWVMNGQSNMAFALNKITGG